MKIQWLGLNAQESPGRLRVCVRVCSGSLNVGGVDGSIRVLWSVPPGQEPYRQSARTTHFTFGWHAFSLSEKAESGVAGMEQEPAHVCVCVCMQVLLSSCVCLCKYAGLDMIAWVCVQVCVCVGVCVWMCVYVLEWRRRKEYFWEMLFPGLHVY